MTALALIIGTDGDQVAGYHGNGTKRRAPRHAARASVAEIIDGR
jgi:hypothetical protein